MRKSNWPLSCKNLAPPGRWRPLVAAAVCLAAVLSGCTSILEGETMSVTHHGEPAPTATDSVIEAGTYNELVDRILGFVMQRQDSGLIRAYGYEGDVAADLEHAIDSIIGDTPFGAYAVSDITGAVKQIVSYQEIELDITYKDVAVEKLDSITTVSTVRFLISDLRDALSNYAPSLTVLTKSLVLSAEDAVEHAVQIYYENPRDIVMLPITTVDFYPSYGHERIIEFTFGYTNKPSTLRVMEQSLKSAVQTVAGEASGDNDGAILLSLAVRLTELSAYDAAPAAGGGPITQNVAATAYGALVTGTAVGEGFAMAYKALCDELGIECFVVLGSLDGRPHAWNIVALDGHYYHADIAMGDLNGLETSFLMADTGMADSYEWKRDAYPACDGPISYTDLTGGA